MSRSRVIEIIADIIQQQMQDGGQTILDTAGAAKLFRDKNFGERKQGWNLTQSYDKKTYTNRKL